MPSYTPVTLPLAVDEDIAIRAEGDYAVLVPKSQKRAIGQDGTTSGWTLTSGSVDFAAQGVTPGMIVLLSFPETSGSNAGKAKRPGAEGAEMFAVDSVNARVLTVRRVGELSGVGQPPAAASSVAYLIQTFAPQIEDVSYDLDRRYGVNQAIPGSDVADFFDPRELNKACVVEVLKRQCKAQARQPDDELWKKADDYQREFDDVVDRGIVHWRDQGGFGISPFEPSTSRFGMRISR